MNENHKTILLLLEQYLTAYPKQRFTQALLNIGINEVAQLPKIYPLPLRDNYNDTDEQVITRIGSKL